MSEMLTSPICRRSKSTLNLEIGEDERAERSMPACPATDLRKRKGRKLSEMIQCRFTKSTAASWDDFSGYGSHSGCLRATREVSSKSLSGVNSHAEPQHDAQQQPPAEEPAASTAGASSFLSMVIEGGAPVAGGVGASGMESNIKITAELSGLQLILTPSYLAGLLGFVQAVVKLAKPLLTAPFPEIPFEPGVISLAITLARISMILPFDQVLNPVVQPFLSSSSHHPVIIQSSSSHRVVPQSHRTNIIQ
ncbi:MAG: hypothetical protein SGPRY_000304 [Prymnesium sp.]